MFLLQSGKEQMFELGRLMRTRYNNFLHSYSPDTVYVSSSDVDRCIVSASCFLAGLYPPEKNQVWNSELNWQPIPVHTVPINMDEVSSLPLS